MRLICSSELCNFVEHNNLHVVNTSASLLKEIVICRMRYVAAYLLASLGGNNNPSAADLEKIIGSVGIEAEADKVKKIIGELKGKDLEQLIVEGTISQVLGCSTGWVQVPIGVNTRIGYNELHFFFSKCWKLLDFILKTYCGSHQTTKTK